MSKKWYWGYISSSIEGTTYIFETLDEARDHAILHNEFDEICGKDNFMAHEESLFFEVCEDELEDYAPYTICNKKEED